ncbi:MAG TPA: alpha/beta hydrolase fold domain-containing protein, partial [Pyrinomonadaceae bacterium]|nr:alpha/beta hydrolase fold domain-containing protein [Pyrinomonadaceae bacterium]
MKRSDRVLGFTARALRRLPVWLQLRLSGRPAVVIDDQQLDPHVQLLLSIHLKRRRQGLCHPTPDEARLRFRRDLRASSGPKTRVRQARDFSIPGEGGPLKVRHYAPFETEARDLLVYLHGGGFVVGDLETHDEVCRLVCAHASTHVLSVDYRLAPEHPFPAGLNDALGALRWAQENAGDFGAEPARVALGGDSAGGNLAAAATWLAAREGSPPLAQLLIYPATDGLAPHASKELF